MAQRSGIPRVAWLLVGLLWGVFLVVMYLTDLLQRCFQTFPYYYFTAAAGVVLIALSIKTILAELRGHGADCGCHSCTHSHDSPEVVHWRRWPRIKAHLLMGLVLMPLAIGVLVPARGLGALAAFRRGGASDPQQILSAFRTERREFVEMEGDYRKLNVLETLDEAYRAKTVKVSTIGFVAHERRAPDDFFQLVRFKMTCCAADAVPIMVQVRWPKARELEGDTWVKIIGTARREKVKGRNVVVITADRIKDIPAPRRPYI